MVTDTKHHYMNVIGPVYAIVRVPFPMPRWRDVLKAMTPVMHRFGYRQKDMWSLDGLLPYPSDPWTRHDYEFAERLACAYARDPACLPAFNLFDWRDGKFVLVREAVK